MKDGQGKSAQTENEIIHHQPVNLANELSEFLIKISRLFTQSANFFRVIKLNIGFLTGVTFS